MVMFYCKFTMTNINSRTWLKNIFSIYYLGHPFFYLFGNPVLVLCTCLKFFKKSTIGYEFRKFFVGRIKPWQKNWKLARQNEKSPQQFYSHYVRAVAITNFWLIFWGKRLRKLNQQWCFKESYFITKVNFKTTSREEGTAKKKMKYKRPVDPHESKGSMGGSKFNWKIKIHITPYMVSKNFSVCPSMTNFDPNYLWTGWTEWAKKN